MTTQDSKTIPLDNNQLNQLNQLLGNLNTDQKLWLGGYLTGLNQGTQTLLQLLNNGSISTQAALSKKTNPESTLNILFGTRSGNAKKLALKASKKASEMGIETNLIDLNEYEPKKLKKEKNILVIVSTDGEGEPPIAAEEFYNYLYSKKAPKLEGVNFSVLALGDKTYQHFCKIGKDIDQRLAELGASRVFDRIDCDLDFEADSTEWISNNLVIQKDLLGTSESTEIPISAPFGNVEVATKESPYNSMVFDKILLNGRGSSKKTWHFEFNIEDSGIQYSPGDSLGIFCKNKNELVDLYLSELGLDESIKVNTFDGEQTLREALTSKYEISRIVPVVVKNFAESTNIEKLKVLATDATELEKYCYGKDLLDLKKDFDLNVTAQDLVNNLLKLQPRLYSIASSYNANPDEIHITVAQVEYKTDKRERLGVCSNYLANLDEDGEAQIFIDENISFRLPEDPLIPIIMIGAGTGVAPYRAFLQERALSDVKGKNWLFFGERNFTSDFIYQTEWQRYKKNGLLTHIDVAFSRDQEEKIYVQHKLLQKSKDVYKWIQDGAHIYLCGDKNTMARDVKKALIDIFIKEGGFSEGSAEDYFRKLRRDKQFQEDVY